MTSGNLIGIITPIMLERFDHLKNSMHGLGSSIHDLLIKPGILPDSLSGLQIGADIITGRTWRAHPVVGDKVIVYKTTRMPQGKYMVINNGDVQVQTVYYSKAEQKEKPLTQSGFTIFQSIQSTSKPAQYALMSLK